MIYYYVKLCFKIYFIMIYYITIVIMIVTIPKDIDYYYDASQISFEIVNKPIVLLSQGL